jgi:hypothetical protein
MKFIKQPNGSGWCGQTCVAMIAEITPYEACKAVGTFNGTHMPQLIRGLKRLKIPCDEQAQRFPRFRNWQTEKERWPSFCLARIKTPNRKQNSGDGFDYHCFIMLDGKIYDPSADGFYPHYPTGSKLLTYIAIYARPNIGSKRAAYFPPLKQICPNCQRNREMPFERTIAPKAILEHCGCYYAGGGILHHVSNPL